MTKLPQKAKKHIELNLKTSNRTLADEIFQKLNIKTTHTTVGKEKKEIMERRERKVERIEEKKPLRRDDWLTLFSAIATRCNLTTSELFI